MNEPEYRDVTMTEWSLSYTQSLPSDRRDGQLDPTLGPPTGMCLRCLTNVSQIGDAFIVRRGNVVAQLARLSCFRIGCIEHLESPLDQAGEIKGR